MHADDGWWRRGVCGALSVEAILWSGDGSVAGSAGIGVLDGERAVAELTHPDRAARGAYRPVVAQDARNAIWPTRGAVGTRLKRQGRHVGRDALARVSPQCPGSWPPHEAAGRQVGSGAKVPSC